MKPIRTLEELRHVLLSRSCPEALTGCWLWLGAKTKGYGDVRAPEFGMRKAHRLSYIAFRGPVDDRLVIDHKCSNPSCVNPDHLEPVTSAENTRRWSERMLVCWRGHAFTGTFRNQRTCRECTKLRMRAHRARLRAGAVTK